MRARVYILLDITKSEVGQAVQILQGKEAVRMVEVLEGSPNIILMIQARSRRSLANMTNTALASVEAITDGVQILPVQNKNNTRLNANGSGKQQDKMLIVREE